MFQLPLSTSHFEYLGIYPKMFLNKNHLYNNNIEELFNTQIYYYLNNPNQKSLEKNTIDFFNKIKICHEIKKTRIYYSISHSNFIDNYLNLKYNERNCYEIIYSSDKQKIYFDIDINTLEKDFKIENIIVFLNQLINSILKVSNYKIKFEDIIIFNSHSSSDDFKKMSYHIIITNYYVKNNNINKKFCEEVVSCINPEFHNYIDNLYSSVQQLRIFKSCKMGSNRLKELDDLSGWKSNDENEILNNSLITYIDNCELLELNFKDKIININVNKSIPKIYTQKEYSSSFAEKTLNKAITLFYDKYDKCKTIFSSHKITGSIIHFSKICSYNCDVCNKTHDNIDSYIIIRKLGDVFRYCHRNQNGDSVYIGNVFDDNIEEDDEYEKKNSKKLNIVINDDFTSLNLYEEEYCKSIVDCDKKIIFIKSACGTGKTTVMIEFIKQKLLLGKTILFITSRISYSTSFTPKLNEILGSEIFKIYRDSEILKITYDYMFCSCESLHRLDHTYDIIILIEQFYSPFHGNNLALNLNFLEFLIKDCDNLLCLDADLDNKVFKYIRNILPNEEIHFDYNSFIPNNDYIYYNKHLYEMITLIYEYLESGKNIQIVSTNKQFGYILYFYIIKLNLIKENEIIYHNGDGDTNKEILENVNNFWKLRVLIYTGVIGAGIDFNQIHYHVLFSFGDFCCGTVRNLVQLEHRVRNLIDKKIFFCHKSYNNNFTINKNEILKNLNNNISINKKFKDEIFTKKDLVLEKIVCSITGKQLIYQTLDVKNICRS
jgi:late competence protein required for DNA uptake (superfamily II DNA/RNA helicase)